MKLIVGLGNPGKSYNNTRHNIGFNVIDGLSRRLRISLKESTGDYLLGKGQYKKDGILLVKPLTYMNNSGKAVFDAADRFDISFSDLLVVCDDLNLPLGIIRFRCKGGDGGNNGLESIIYHLQTTGFSRLRIGIGKEPMEDDYVDFVLSKFEDNEEETVRDIIDIAVLGAVFWLERGIDEAMNLYNNRVIE